jgi:MYXO-CTERM domain-containing protein
MRCPRRSTSLILSTLTLLSFATPAVAQEYFAEQPNAFGAQPCGGSGCWTNFMQLTDIDNDGDLDVLFPNAQGFFTKGGAEPFVVYKNNGNATFVDASAEAVGGFAGWIRQVAVGDVNGDGFTDIYAPSGWGDPDAFFINDGTGKFKDESAARLPNVKSNAGATRFGDIDNDGDLDLLVGDNWTGLNGGALAHLYLNDGSGKFTEAAWELPKSAAGDQPIDFDLFDLDGDFDLDLYIDMHSGGKASLWQNDGTGKFTDLTASVPNQAANGYYRYGPVACDVDGDGDLDVWQDNALNPGGLEQLMINDGTGKLTDETAARVTGNPGADDNGVACIDVDGDGDLDAAIMSLTDVERVLINDGTGKFSLSPGAFTSIDDPTLWFDFGDLNGDGKLDAVTSQGEGNPKLNRVYLGTASSPVDAVAPKLRAVEAVSPPTPDGSPVVRFAVSDNSTSDEGPRLQKAYLKITAPAASEVKAVFMGGDLFRAVLPAQAGGTEVSFQACAKDRQGNEGCSMAFSYKVSGTGPATTGSGGSGGSGGAGGNGGDSGSTGGAGGNDTGGNDTGGKGGCGCAVPGTDPGSGALALGIAGALAALARVRRPLRALERATSRKARPAFGGSARRRNRR